MDGRTTRGGAVGRRQARAGLRAGVLRAVLLGTVLATMTVLGTAATAAAAGADPCDPVVLAGSKVTPAVSDAVDALAATGAVPVVRVWKHVPDGDLDLAVTTLVEECTDWSGGADTTLDADVVVLAVSLDDRRSGVYYGSTHDAALDAWWEPMLTDTVNPLLKKGKPVAAVVAGLGALTDRVTEQQASDAAGSGSSGISAPGDAGGGQGGVTVEDPVYDGGFDEGGFSDPVPGGGSGFGAVVVLGVVGVLVTGVLAMLGVGSGRRRTATGSGFVGSAQDPTWVAGGMHHQSGFTGGPAFDGGASFGGSSSGSSGSDSGSSGSSGGGDMGGGSTSW